MAEAEAIDWRRYAADQAYMERIDREDRERRRVWSALEISPAVLEAIKTTRLKPEPSPPEPDWRRYAADDAYMRQIDREQRGRGGSPIIEITRAELEQVKAEVAARPKPAETKIDWRRDAVDDEYRSAVDEYLREQHRTAILEISGGTMRAWVETKDEYAARAKREATIDWRRYAADDAYMRQIDRQDRQHRGEQVIYIKLKDFERPAAASARTSNPGAAPS
jgi:hypothetical protein